MKTIRYLIFILALLFPISVAAEAWNPPGGYDVFQRAMAGGTYPGSFTTLSVSGVASFANGTAAAPSIAFTSDPNLGLYRVGADSLGMTLNSLVMGNDGGTPGTLSVDASGNWSYNKNITTSGTVTTTGVIGNATDLKLNATAAGDVVLFGGTPVGDTADGRSWWVKRMAAEGDDFIHIYIDNLQQHYIKSNSNLRILAANGLHFNASGGGKVYIGTYGGNVELFHHGTITAASAQKYVKWQVDDADDYFHLARQDANILGFKVDMPLEVTSEMRSSRATITAGAGTGITKNEAGRVTQHTYEVTTTYAAYAAAATTKGIVIATLPAKTKIVAIYADTTVAYTGGAVSAATLEVGITAEGAAEILAPHDVLSAAILAGDADAEMGTSMTRAAAIQGGYLPSWSGTTAIYATIDTTSANTDALTAGSTKFYIVTERY